MQGGHRSVLVNALPSEIIKDASRAPSQATLDEGLDLSEENRRLRHEVDDLRLRLQVATEGEDNKLQLLVPSVILHSSMSLTC